MQRLGSNRSSRRKSLENATTTNSNPYTNSNTNTNSKPNTNSYAYTNTNTIKAGVEFTPNRYDVRHLLKRWSYRLGFRYGTYNQTFNGEYLDQYAVTAGIGIPVKFFGISMIDVGVEYGLRGTNLAPKLGLVSQQYFKFGVGFSLFAGAAENNEYWFTRPKYD